MFSRSLADVFLVLNAWAPVGVQVVPNNYQGTITTDTFARVAVLPSRPDIVAHGLVKKISGLLIVSLFTPTGGGDKQVFQLADTLSVAFDGKHLPNGTQFKVGSLSSIELDSVNKALYRVDYSNNFSIYGE